ncbi:MAG: hypothetical protein WCY29_07230 [Novosphingobium sp.]
MVLSPKEIRERLSRIGRTPADVARELGVSVVIVRGVIDGRFKGDRGEAHKVAVALGLKDGLIIDDNTSTADAIKLAAGR